MKALAELAVELGRRLERRRLKVATAESCTGGWIAMEITAIAGSSTWFERGFVTYSNEAKSEMLAVPPADIATHGAVSEPVARAMAEGALAHSAAQLSVSVTGVAGPGGGSPSKPVGTVCFGWAGLGDARTTTFVFSGDRESVRRQSVAAAIQGLLDRLEERQ